MTNYTNILNSNELTFSLIYNPGGMPMLGRYSVDPTNEIRHGFNGKEDIDEVYNNPGTFQDYGFRMYDTRLVRFISPDPIIVYGKKYPELTPYQFASNTPIWAIDLDGLEGITLFDNENLSSQDDAIQNVGLKNMDKSAIHVYGHGYYFGIWNGSHGLISDPIAFDKMLKEKSDSWKSRKTGQKMVIVLHACRTGRDNYTDNNGNVYKDSFAKRLSGSKEFKDATIIAPDERVLFTYNKKDAKNSGKEVGPMKLKYHDKESDVKEDANGREKPHTYSNQYGNWNVYLNGELIYQYEGNWAPTGNSSFIDKLLYGKE